MTDTLRIQAELELGKRSISGSLGQLSLLAIFTFGLGVYEHYPRYFMPLGSTILILKLLLFMLCRHQARFYPEYRAQWNRLFTLCHVVPAAAWGILFFLLLGDFGIPSFATTIGVLVGSGIAAGLSTVLSPRARLARITIAIILAIPLAKLMMILDRRALCMAMIFVTYYVFLWFQIRIQNKTYWANLTNRERLVNERNRLQSVLDAIPGLVAWIGSDLTYRGANRNYARYFGTAPAQLAGRLLGCRKKDREFIQAVEEFMASPSEQLAREIRISGQDGPRWHLLVMRKYETETYLICIDIEALKQVQEELDKERVKTEIASKLAAVGEFTAGVTHEIKNPLAALGTAIQLIQRDVEARQPDRERIKGMADRAMAMTGRIDKIVRSLTRFSRRTEEEPFSLSAVKQIVQDAIDLTEAWFNANGVRLLATPVDGSVRIWCRPIEISQVLVNLLNNAMDAVKGLDDRWVRLEASAGDNQVNMRVTDSGRGIPKRVADRMFEPLFTTKPPGAGTGLGLSISRRIVERHGGRIEIDDSAPHTTFVLRLPAAKAGNKRQAAG